MRYFHGSERKAIIDPSQLKSKIDLYKKAYHESVHRWLYNQSPKLSRNIPHNLEEKAAALYGWVKGNLRYYFHMK